MTHFLCIGAGMINLHEECKQRLVLRLAEMLPQLTVDHNKFLNFNSAIVLFELDKILSESGKTHDELEKYIGDFPVASFVRDYIGNDIRFNEYNAEVEGVSLTEYEGYSDVKLVSHAIVEQFCGLPYLYLTIFELPDNISNVFSKIGKTIHFSKEITVVKPHDEYDKEFPLKTGDTRIDSQLFMHRGFLSSFTDKSWDKSKYYLCISSQGFIATLFETATQRAMVNNIKALFGLLIALRFFKFNRNFLPSYRAFEEIHYKFGDGKFKIAKVDYIAKEISETLEGMIIENFDGAVDENKQIEFHEMEFSKVRKVYSNDSRNIQLAAQWLLESHATSNNILSFIQAAISIEILLGDETYNQDISLTELLTNRCAYLIGTSSEERDEIIKNFREIYRFRSKIVHRGINQLKGNGFALLQKLRWLCSRVIQEEIRLIKK